MRTSSETGGHATTPRQPVNSANGHTKHLPRTKPMIAGTMWIAFLIIGAGGGLVLLNVLGGTTVVGEKMLNTYGEFLRAARENWADEDDAEPKAPK